MNRLVCVYMEIAKREVCSPPQAAVIGRLISQVLLRLVSNEGTKRVSSLGNGACAPQFRCNASRHREGERDTTRDDRGFLGFFRLFDGSPVISCSQLLFLLRSTPAIFLVRSNPRASYFTNSSSSCPCVRKCVPVCVRECVRVCLFTCACLCLRVSFAKT